jgi:hypothetical protein
MREPFSALRNIHDYHIKSLLVKLVLMPLLATSNLVDTGWTGGSEETTKTGASENRGSVTRRPADSPL